MYYITNKFYKIKNIILIYFKKNQKITTTTMKHLYTPKHHHKQKIKVRVSREEK